MGYFLTLDSAFWGQAYAVDTVLYAVDPLGELIEPAPKAVGKCSLCKLPLIPKCGPINIWHWSHRAGDCDPWNEGETDWHREWKRRAPRDWCEVVMSPHRADIRRPDSLVIELQYSSISVPDIAAREKFYGNMWWLFHRSRFGKNARFFLQQDGRVRLRWLNGSRTLPLVTKHIFADLGGPIVEFTERLRREGGYGRLLSRAAFIAAAGLNPLSLSEAAEHSHYEVRWPPAVSGNVGVIAPSDEDLDYWRGSVRDGGQVRDVRADNTFEILR